MHRNSFFDRRNTDYAMDSYGHLFRLTTYGESHGAAIGGVLEGCPSGLKIDTAFIASELRRRRGEETDGCSTARKEDDVVKILSGVFDGIATGTALAFEIENHNACSSDYEPLRECCRPGHADYTYRQRHDLYDYRGGGRASARETAARVVGGAIAKQILALHGITIDSRCEVAQSHGNGESTGGCIICTIAGVPAGIGSPVFNKLNASMAFGMMSIPSAIGFEMGSGFGSTAMSGREYADAWMVDGTTTFGSVKTKSNHCGGVQGGISNGMPITLRVAFHPVVTHGGTTHCLGTDGEIKSIEIGGRHDRCQVPRAAVIVEAMAALTITDQMMMCGALPLR